VSSAERWGLEEAQSNGAGRRTGIPLRRDVGPPGTSPATGGMTATSSIRTVVCCINPAPTRETFCALPWEICRLSREGLRVAGAALIIRQKSAEGIVGPRQARRVRHPDAERRGTREAGPLHREPNARTVPREGHEGKESSLRVESRYGIRQAARAAPGRCGPWE
jgi:hypothetical protein